MDLNSILSAVTSAGSEQISKTTGADSSQVTDLLSSALPTLLGAMKNNAGDKSKAAGLSKALDDHAQDDITDVAAFLKTVDVEDGAKILKHLLGNDNEKIQSKLADKSGLDISQVATSLSSIAPLLLSFLGQQKQKSSNNDLDLGSLIGGFIGGDNNIAETLMDGLSGFLKK
ncbi:MAG: DUF937 domain-containing protein [Erysipelotrichaceae bacterium]